MRILLSGSSGFIGSAVRSHFEKRGDEVVSLVRKSPDSFDFSFSQEKWDAVIHLAGEPVMGYWTAEKKKRIWASRVDATRKLSQYLSTLTQPPKVFISASAVGYYGDRGNALLTEESLPGEGFLAAVCSAWEKAAQVDGIRCVQTRFGIVVGQGGALQKMLWFYRLGLGGTIGSGQQWISWVALEDVVRAIDFVLNNPALQGAVNVVAPNALRQSDWAKTLAQFLHRPSFLSIPSWIIRLFLGEMGKEMILSSTRVFPKKLEKSGFQFSCASLQKVLSVLPFKENL